MNSSIVFNIEYIPPTIVDAEAFEDAPEDAEVDYQPGNILKNIDIPVRTEQPQQTNPEQQKFEVEFVFFFFFSFMILCV